MGVAKSGRQKNVCDLIAAFDIGKNTGYALRKSFHSPLMAVGRSTIKLSSGSGSPSEVSDMLSLLKSCRQVTLLFYYDNNFLNGKSIEYLRRVRKFIVESILFKARDVRIMLFNEGAVFRKMINFEGDISSDQKKEITINFCSKSNFKPKGYDESDAIMLLLHYMKFNQKLSVD